MLRKALLVAFAAAAQLVAQDVRELSTPVDHVTLTAVTSASITAKVNEGFRVTDIEYRGTNILLGNLYDAVLVKNTGSYATGWWWYTGLTSTQVGNNLNANNARLIDLEPYEDSNGNLRFACVMVDNTGSNAKAFWWYFGTTTANIGTQLSTNNARLVDLDDYTYNGITYYSAVMISNTGGDARSWWWYLNQTTAQVSSNLNANQAQIYDLERRSNGNWDVVMIRDPAPQAWYWWIDATRAELDLLVGNYGLRVIDIESYATLSGTRYAFVAINNSNALSSTISGLMRGATDGSVGAWMQRINGSNVVDLNSTRIFEPASTMKTLHHVHAMRRVYLGAVSLGTVINVFTNYSSPTSSCPIDTGGINEMLQTSLRLMMENSDNARTQAIRTYFGEANLNATATALGMDDTESRHRLGCGAEAIANPNRITLRDLHALHDAVAGGYLGSFRANFYDLMNNSINDLSVASIMSTEGASLGLPSTTITTFRNLSELAHKGGNYSLNNGGPQYYQRAEFGYLALPAISGNQVVMREYSFGAFVNDASVDSGAADAIYQNALPEMFASVIRSAMQTWTNNLAVVSSIGAGCGIPNQHTQSAIGLPRFGSSVTYRTINGFANSLEVLGIGFSTSSWNGISLPASVSPYGGFPGCQAYIAIAINEVGFSNASGTANFGISIPSSTGFLGFDYLTQGYSFSSQGSFVTSNALRTTVGF
ncbi:MAG: hypothetical protein RL398_1487 [Planctomycetota bacterium]|jgi:hypothetical protein